MPQMGGGGGDDRGFGRGGYGGGDDFRGRGRGGRRGRRGGRGRRGRRGRGRRGGDKEEWVPHTKLGRLVKEGKIELEDIYLWAIPIKEPEIIDKFLSMTLKDEVLQIK